MSDFNALEWCKQPLDGVVPQALRRDVRKYRRERGRSGHRFAYSFLKTLWAASDAAHAVLNHTDDLAWQMWYRHPEEGWQMVSWHITRREAQAAAESRLATLIPEGERPSEPGLYVLAGSSLDRLTIRVACSSETTAAEMEGIYDRLGFVTLRETVSAPVG